MLITLETSLAEELHHAAIQMLQRAEEFAGLYGVGTLSQQTMLELMGLPQHTDRTPPIIFESTPLRRPNAIMVNWGQSVAGGGVEQGGHAMCIRGLIVQDLIHTDD